MPTTRSRRGPAYPTYDTFDWHYTPFPDGVVAFVHHPKYDANFDVEGYMREGGYDGPCRLPEDVTVRMHANLIPRPCGEIMTAREYRGNRDYLEYLGILVEPEVPYNCQRRGTYTDEDGFLDGLPMVRRSARLNPNIDFYKGNYIGGIGDRRPRLRGGMRHGAMASRSDTSTYHMPHISQHTAASRSTSSHRLPTIPVNMFAHPTQPAWVGGPPPTPINSGYIGVAGYDPSMGYAVGGPLPMVPGPTPVACVVPQVMDPDVQIIAEHPPVNQGNLQNTGMGDVNEFFVYHGRPPANEAPPPMSSTPNNYANENDYTYENQQMYPPVMAQPVFQPQHEPPVVRTAAGGEIVKFGEQSDNYEQPQEANPCSSYQYSAANGETFANYDVVSDMGQPSVPPVNNIYAPPVAVESFLPENPSKPDPGEDDEDPPFVAEEANVYTNPVNVVSYPPEDPAKPDEDCDGSNFAVERVDSVAGANLDDHFVKEDGDGDDPNIGQEFFSD